MLGWLAAQSAALPKAAVPAVPDVTIMTRQTIDHENSSISTTIVHSREPASGGKISSTEITRSQDQWGTTTSKIELIEFSDAPLDAALFTVPAEYRPALPDLFGGFDLTKADTVMNRLHSYWDGVRAWADG